jgi:hypothetical protein
MMLEGTLLSAAVFAVLVWAALAVYVARLDRQRRAARAVVSSIVSALDSEGLQSVPLEDRAARVRPLLERVSRDMLLHTAADAATPRVAAAAITAYVLDRWGEYILLRNASSHRLSRDVWRRTASLTVLFNHGHPQIFDLLSRAVSGADADVASVAFAARHVDRPAGRDSDSGARRQRHPASRIAVHLEHSRRWPAETYRRCSSIRTPPHKFWGATLLDDYSEVDWVERTRGPRRRSDRVCARQPSSHSAGPAAIAAEAALRLLNDPTPFVRAHAAHARSGRLNRADAAPAVAGTARRLRPGGARRGGSRRLKRWVPTCGPSSCAASNTPMGSSATARRKCSRISGCSTT